MVSKICTKKCAIQAVRVFFLIQAIKINHWFVALLVPFLSLFLKLPIKRDPTVLRNPSGTQGNQLVIYKPDEVESAVATGKKSNKWQEQDL